MKKTRQKSNSIVLTEKSGAAASVRDDAAGSSSSAAAAAKKEAEKEAEANALVVNAFANSKASNMDLAVGSSAVQDLLGFLNGDSKIADFKLRYISHIAGYNGAELKGKRWSFAKDGSDYRFFIYPDTLEYAFQSMGDFSMKKMYGTLSNVLSKFPKVEIRSFQQHTLLQTIADSTGTALTDVASGIGKTIKSLWDKTTADKTKKDEKKFTETIKNYWGEDPASAGSLFGKIIQGANPEKFKGGSHAALLDLPFIFYYCLASSVTRCYFTLPLDSRSYENLWGSASQGWVNSKASTLAGKVEAIRGISDLGIGSLLTTAFTRSFGIQFMPTFDASQVDTEGDGALDLTFVLMNDTEGHAMSNTAFLRVLFPSAMWSNVGVFAISGDLFDVKVKGAMRWLMCTARLECSPVGAIRTLYGTNMKVPDAYKVHCTFKSLIPNNLNNYLIGYLSNFTITNRDSALGMIYKNIKKLFPSG